MVKDEAWATGDLAALRARHQPEPCDHLQGCYVCSTCRVHSLSLPVCDAAALGDALQNEAQARQAAEALLCAHQDVLRRVRAALALTEERALPIEALVAEVVAQAERLKEA